MATDRDSFRQRLPSSAQDLASPGRSGTPSGGDIRSVAVRQRHSASADSWESAQLLDRERMAVPNDSIRMAQIQERALTDRIKQHEKEVRIWQEREQKQFTLKFNQLVEAVAQFGKSYNEGRGGIWPHREADRLSKAMHQLQSVEKRLLEQKAEPDRP